MDIGKHFEIRNQKFPSFDSHLARVMSTFRGTIIISDNRLNVFQKRPLCKPVKLFQAPRHAVMQVPSIRKINLKSSRKAHSAKMQTDENRLNCFQATIKKISYKVPGECQFEKSFCQRKRLLVATLDDSFRLKSWPLRDSRVCLKDDRANSLLQQTALVLQFFHQFSGCFRKKPETAW